MEAAVGNPLTESYYARVGHTVKEMPIERAAERERLWRRKA